jgi:hypothetical protein
MPNTAITNSLAPPASTSATPGTFAPIGDPLFPSTKQEDAQDHQIPPSVPFFFYPYRIYTTPIGKVMPVSLGIFGFYYITQKNIVLFFTMIVFFPGKISPAGELQGVKSK